MTIWPRFTGWLGALPARHVTWALALLFSAWAIGDQFSLRLTHGLSQSTYDAMVRARVYAAPADPRIVIIDIDEGSLSRMAGEFGRWPWPRDTLATVLDYLERQAPAAIAWDLVFSDADRMSPGGDKALDEAARRSQRSHFSVVRLPAQNDSQSALGQAVLPGLWLPGTPAKASTTLALIPPVLPSVAAASLGYNNGYPDPDGVLRRYLYAEPLADGSAIQSIALAVARSLPDTVNATKNVANHQGWMRTTDGFDTKSELMAWRASADSYPRVPFADIFAAAEGGKPLRPLPSFAGKVVLVGATAPSLHDIHPTPLSPTQAGVDSLATAIDNAIHGRHVAELPRSVQALLAVLLCLGLAAWVQRFGIASLDAALLLLPGSLIAVSYLTLNGTPVFVDLNLSAGVALFLLTALRTWNGWRRNHWCGWPAVGPAWALMPLRAGEPLANTQLDRMLGLLERHAPQCRLMCADATATWPNRLRWPEWARNAAVVGPQAQLLALRHAAPRGIQWGESVSLPDTVTRTDAARQAQQACHALNLSANLESPR